MKRLSAFFSTWIVITLLGTVVWAAGRDPAITKESKDYLDRIRKDGFVDRPDRGVTPPPPAAPSPSPARGTAKPAPAQPAPDPNLQDLKQRENLAIQIGRERARRQLLYNAAVEASMRIIQRKETTPSDVIRLYLEHEETNLKANEAETKEILKAAEELELTRRMMGAESVKGNEADPEIAAARETYAWCARYLDQDYKRQGLDAQLAAIDRCFKKMHWPLSKRQSPQLYPAGGDGRP